MGKHDIIVTQILSDSPEHLWAGVDNFIEKLSKSGTRGKLKQGGRKKLKLLQFFDVNLFGYLRVYGDGCLVNLKDAGRFLLDQFYHTSGGYA